MTEKTGYAYGSLDGDDDEERPLRRVSSSGTTRSRRPVDHYSPLIGAGRSSHTQLLRRIDSGGSSGVNSPRTQSPMTIPRRNSLGDVVDRRAEPQDASSNAIPTFATPLVAAPSSSPENGHSTKGPAISPGGEMKVSERSSSSGPTQKGGFLYYVIYACVNSIMCVPCLYGYASVIFNHEAFQPHLNALSKLVIFSSVVHQFAFSIFSTLPFAIGQVQDAGLIFLSAMGNTIANSILKEGGTVEEALSTTIVLLGAATASLGFVLMVMGKLKLADAVAYLPLPVVGGYLAFIGYFCLEAGVALCISQPMVGWKDWVYLLDSRAMLLATPGILCGVALTWISRFCHNDAALPIAMVCIPTIFYAFIFALGLDIEDVREEGWVGEKSPPVPVTDLFNLVHLSDVRWDLMSSILSTWAGMVLVVSFSSCLDVAAISMDMGQALDVNMELMTVGISNFVSGLTCGFTGSYIFSQTIFTYRTGCHSRWIGLLVAFSFVAVVVSTVNFLEITPLFFLGSTLMFIGFDLLYEWIIEIRHKLLLAEYSVLLATFVAIQIIGIDGGILFGCAVAVVDYVVTTAKTSSLSRVSKRSRVVWNRKHFKLLQDHGYHMEQPKIVTLEVKGSVFFGSSLRLLNTISEEICIDSSSDERREINFASPRHVHINSSPVPPSFSSKKKSLKRILSKQKSEAKGRNGGKPKTSDLKTRPKFVVLDLGQVPNIDASAARGCFLQLAKMCAKRGMMLCASGANARVDWMLRSHDVAYNLDEESVMKDPAQNQEHMTDENSKILLFETIYEALEFCENKLILQLESDRTSRTIQPFERFGDLMPPSGKNNKISLSTAFTHFLGLRAEDAATLSEFESAGQSFHTELNLRIGEIVFERNTHADAFFVVLAGTVAIFLEEGKENLGVKIVSGAGRQKVARQTSNLAEKRRDLGEVGLILQVGSIFGFVDFILERPRSFSTAAAQDGTVVAKLPRSGLDRLKAENPTLDRIVDKVLLEASIRELANVSEP